ncbi:MAG: chorismate synthase [Parachlamydiaceae bacterium]|nr:chorismate synthase [Parachlamydiaceae bacterium]
MASNSFGNIFKITTWGESHGRAIGVVIDGCPAGFVLNDDIINKELAWRAPGRNTMTSLRKETDCAEILSGVFEGKTTGCPISIIIWNTDSQSQHYESLKNVLRPGHANYTYLEKYGCFDHRGGGRASARETACRVAGGAVAKTILSDLGVGVVSHLKSVGRTESEFELSDLGSDASIIQERVRRSSIFCPFPETEAAMISTIEETKSNNDSIGGVVEATALNVPAGWGDPIYEKLEANLAKAMLSIPASKGFEIGSGFSAGKMEGSNHNDLFVLSENKIQTSTNNAGGTLGGISTGMPIVVRVAFKPTSSINKQQKTVDLNGNEQLYKLPEGSRHDPCVAIRAVPVVEAMMALVLIDAMLMNKCVQHI